MTFSTISRPPERRWAALALIITAQFMVILDVAIVNVALPSIQTDLHFSQAGLQWVISAYAILFGGVLLLGGRLADLLGRLARRLPRPPGPRRCAARAGGAVAAHDDLPRGPRAESRTGHLRRGIR